jgi:60 kDa SS-A/Ro ribonucleoprotein
LAICASAEDEKVRKAALAALPKVARIGTHLFHYASFVEGFRGWGRALRKAIGNWYLEMPVDKLANQVSKYSQRDGWSNRDLLRLSHPKTSDVTRNTIFKWVVDGVEGLDMTLLHPYLLAVEVAKKATDEKEIISLIQDHNLPRECIPTQWLNSPKIWEALLEKMPMTAMIRNLAKMTSIGLISPMSAAEKRVKTELGNEIALRKARVHPIQILSAMMTYQGGHGVRGSLTWNPNRAILDALDAAFYTSFGNVEPTGKNTLLALDVSGSMTRDSIVGIENLSPRVGSAALALITANVEPNYEIIGFTAGGWTASGPAKSAAGYGWYGSGSAVKQLSISPRQRLDDVIRYINSLGFSGTDCALPVLWAQAQKIPVESFSVYTDSETWEGPVQPSQALRDYRNTTGIPAKLAVVGMVSNGFTLADPKDKGMLDVVGFDLNCPQLLSDFFKA